MGADMKLLPFTPALSPRIRLVTVEQCWSVCEGLRVGGPYQAHGLFVPYFDGKDREHFVVLHLDATHVPISVEVVSIGTLNSALVHPREVFKGAILANAKAIIAAHNHPSGDTEPSREDHLLSQALKSAGKLLDIPLLDFLIVSGTQFRSLVDPSVGRE